MASDQTEPRNNLILIYTILTTVTLLVLAPMFLSFFKGYVEAQVENVVLSQPADRYEETKAAALEALENGRMPIDQAVQTLGQQGRDASPLIAPEPSDDLAAVEGWGQAKNEEAAESAKKAVEQRIAAEEAARQEALEAGEDTTGAGTEGGQAAASGGAAADEAPSST